VSDEEYEKWKSTREETIRLEEEMQFNGKKDEENDMQWEETPYLPDKNDKIEYSMQKLEF